MKKSSLVALCGLSTALSVTFMFLGGLVYVFAYLVPIVLGLLLVCLKKTFGISCALITYTASSVLGLILVTDKECIMSYIFIFGFYSVMKDTLDKIKFKPIRVITKLLILNALLAISQLIIVYLFKIPFFEGKATVVFAILFGVGMNFIFVIFDVLIGRTVIIYEYKLEKRVKRLFK